MNRITQLAIAALFTLTLATMANAQAKLPGTQEFGLTEKELAQNIEKVEALIAKCMREQGFEYVAVDFITVRRGMSADKHIPGMSEEEFIEKYGFGVATLYTGAPPQLNKGYSPTKVGLGEQNVQYYQNLSEADQVAYNRALFGENADASFAVGLETENFSRCGGCTRKAIEKVFTEDQVKATYYNPLDAKIVNDPRMKAAIRKYAEAMSKKGYDYKNPDEVEEDIRARLYGITEGKTLPIVKMTIQQRVALQELRDLERRVAIVHFELAEEIIDPVEETIEKELFARPVN